MTSKVWRSVATVTAMTVLAAVVVPVAARAASQPKAVAQDVNAPAQGSGLQVAVDDKGRIRQPTREEAQAFMREVARLFDVRSTTAKVTQHPGGMVSAELGEGFSNFYLARIDADGSIGSACVDDAGAAAAFFGAASGLEEK